MKKIIIVGGGWYGCHIETILKYKYDIHMVILQMNYLIYIIFIHYLITKSIQFL
jgi:hypothetical protein